MIHYRNGLPDDAKVDELVVSRFEERYKEVLQKAKEEYDYIPTSDYY